MQFECRRSRDEREESPRIVHRDSNSARPMYDASMPPLRAAREFLDEVRAAYPTYSLPAGAAVRRRRGAAGDRRPRARHARRERERPAVHRRFRRHPALRDAACVRLRVVAGVANDRRSADADRLPHHQRGQVPAAGRTSRCRPKCARATTTSPPTSRRCPTGGAVLALGRIAHDAALRALRSARARLSVRARRAARAAARHRAVRQLSLQPLQHQHRAPDAARCSARCSTPSPRISAAASTRA